MTTLLDLLTNRIRRISLPYLRSRAKRLKESVWQLNARTILKISEVDINRAEVDAMRFVTENTTIPIPRLYDHWERGGEGYIIMEFVEGITLRRAWKTLTEAQRAHVMRTIAGYVYQLRALPQPPPPPTSGLPRTGWIGSASCRGFSDMLAYANYTPIGPLPNEAAWHDWRIPLYELALSIPVYAERLAQIRKKFRDDDPIVFTHGDLVRVDGEGPEDVKVTAVLDWEQAGWRPIYWEGIKRRWMEGKPDWVQFMRENLNAGYEWAEALEAELLKLGGGLPPA